MQFDLLQKMKAQQTEAWSVLIIVYQRIVTDLCFCVLIQNYFTVKCGVQFLSNNVGVRMGCSLKVQYMTTCQQIWF